MALTKYNFWIGVIFVTVAMAIGFMIFGTELANRNDITLDNKSLDYIESYGGYVSNANLESMTQDNANILKEDSLTGDDNETGQQSVQDFLANLNYYKSRIEKIKNYIMLVYNIPTFLIISVGIPIEHFSWLTNLINIIFYISLLYLFIKMIRGS